MHVCKEKGTLVCEIWSLSKGRESKSKNNSKMVSELSVRISKLLMWIYLELGAYVHIYIYTKWKLSCLTLWLWGLSTDDDNDDAGRRRRTRGIKRDCVQALRLIYRMNQKYNIGRGHWKCSILFPAKQARPSGFLFLIVQSFQVIDIINDDNDPLYIHYWHINKAIALRIYYKEC